MIFSEKPETLQEVILPENNKESYGLYDIDHLNQFYIQMTFAKSMTFSLEVEDLK